jgi:hypothetical protein
VIGEKVKGEKTEMAATHFVRQPPDYVGQEKAQKAQKR